VRDSRAGWSRSPNLARVVKSGADFDALLDLRDRGQIEILPTALLEEMSGQIPDMKPLHHQDDGIALLVIKPRQQGGAIPLNEPLPG
jgi:hypothetical protein